MVIGHEDASHSKAVLFQKEIHSISWGQIEFVRHDDFLNFRLEQGEQQQNLKEL